MWRDLQRWRPALLLDGGVLQQPAWVWDMVNLAGDVYESTVASNAEMLQGLAGKEQETVGPDGIS